jgi:hypothetical protein
MYTGHWQLKSFSMTEGLRLGLLADLASFPDAVRGWLYRSAVLRNIPQCFDPVALEWVTPQTQQMMSVQAILALRSQ